MTIYNSMKEKYGCVFSLVSGVTGSIPVFLILLIAMHLYVILEAMSMEKKNCDVIDLLLNVLQILNDVTVKMVVPTLG